MKTTVAQLARDVGVKSQKIWYLINNGFLPAPAIEIGKRKLYDSSVYSEVLGKLKELMNKTTTALN